MKTSHEQSKQLRQKILFWGTTAALVAVPIWAANFQLEESTVAPGEVIASKRVQVIEAVDGGVLAELLVREGDRVEPGQVLAILNQTRVGASVAQMSARVYALKAKQARLRAEVTDQPIVNFPSTKDGELKKFAQVESSLFRQRRQSLQQDLKSLEKGLGLALTQQKAVERLLLSGDISAIEKLRAEQGVNEAEARQNARRNKFYEEARQELTTVENELAQSNQELLRKSQEQRDSYFRSSVRGTVKNVKTTTLGGVISAGEELMQIVPINDALLVEAKVRPSDIGRIRKGLTATIRFDPFDYTLYGDAKGKVIYVSADTLKESTLQGESTYYRVHVALNANPLKTSTGRLIEVLPGMTTRVYIKTGSQSVLSYLLKPIRKTLSESLRES